MSEQKAAQIGPFGITWADTKDTLFQTGYVYPTVVAAEVDANRVLRGGPTRIAADIQVDEMTEGGMDRTPLYAYIETEDDTVKEITL